MRESCLEMTSKPENVKVEKKAVSNNHFQEEIKWIRCIPSYIYQTKEQDNMNVEYAAIIIIQNKKKSSIICISKSSNTGSSGYGKWVGGETFPNHL